MIEFLAELGIEVPEIIVTLFSLLCSILFFLNNHKIGKSEITLQTAVKEKIKYVDNENVKIQVYINKELEKVNEAKNELANEKERIKKENEGMRRGNAKLRKTLLLQDKRISELEKLIKICALNSKELVKNGISKIVIETIESKEEDKEADDAVR